MSKRLSSVVAASILVGAMLLATGSVAIAAPVTPAFTITADRAASVPAGHTWAFNDFFPRSATIATGSSFQFTNEGFHTATLLPASWSVAADNDVNGALAADVDDAQHNPNGTIKSVFNIPALMPVPAQGCGTAETPCEFDGSSIVSMGAPLGPPAPFVVKVTAPPGTYAFHCRVHPGMVGTLTVVAADAAGTTTAASADAAAAAQATEDVAAGMAAETAASTAGKSTNANGTTTWKLTAGTSDPAGRVAILEMLPKSVSIKKGDTVVWRPLDRNEPHTITFPKTLGSSFIPLCEGPGGKDTPAVPTVVPPTGPFDFACNGGPVHELELTGGNGVTTITSPATVSDSGVVGYRSEAFGFDLPINAIRTSWWVRFTGAKAGTYNYVCMIHEGMAGTIVVK